MSLTYFKRFRMEIDLRGRTFACPPLADGYRLAPWHESLMEAHAEAKYASFRGEIDANVFPCLSEYSGCLRLMREIARKDGFLPESTWLAIHDDGATGRSAFVGTVQGIRERGLGAIQNLGVSPDRREQHLGTVLMVQALAGFQRAGLAGAFLEVTAQNEAAIRLYRRLGFWKVKTVYKAVEVAYS